MVFAAAVDACLTGLNQSSSIIITAQTEVADLHAWHTVNTDKSTALLTSLCL